MISSDLTARADAMITPDMVVRRMLDMIDAPWAQITIRPSDRAGIIAAHKRVADRSACTCPYCRAIKAYVSTKLMIRRLTREYYDFPTGLTRNRLSLIIERLPATIIDKEIAKTLDISAYVLGAESA